ncbi:type II toxin-antitoxin system VapC family toxin [Candidatus Woesearchaeota archaeon]|nr:type II toxin-antitoxin system VapC family toxin [Candidatus Woesearchaeota archaeon]
MKGKEEPKKLLKKIGKAVLYISEINVFEIGAGIMMHGSKKEFNVFIDFLENIELIPATTNFALDAAVLSGILKKKGIKIGSMDLLIVGMMQNFGINKIITRNKKHFENIPGIEVISY